MLTAADLTRRLHEAAYGVDVVLGELSPARIVFTETWVAPTSAQARADPAGSPPRIDVQPSIPTSSIGRPDAST